MRQFCVGNYYHRAYNESFITSDNHSENYEDPEEKVRAEYWAELIYQYDYPASRIKVKVVIPDRLPTDRADIVVFSDDECKRPFPQMIAALFPAWLKLGGSDLLCRFCYRYSGFKKCAKLNRASVPYRQKKL